MAAEAILKFPERGNAMPSVSFRLQHFTESVIRSMTRLANEHGAINLSQGFPDFDPPAELLEAAAKALGFPDSYYRSLREDYQDRRDIFLHHLDRAGLSYTNPEGAYYVMVDISPFGWRNDTAFCEWLTREIGVAAVPGSSFFAEPVHRYIRLHFAKKKETLEEAGERLYRLREKG